MEGKTLGVIFIVVFLVMVQVTTMVFFTLFYSSVKNDATVNQRLTTVDSNGKKPMTNATYTLGLGYGGVFVTLLLLVVVIIAGRKEKPTV